MILCCYLLISYRLQMDSVFRAISCWLSLLVSVSWFSLLVSYEALEA